MIKSLCTVATYCFADGRCLFKLFDKEISKKCRSVSPFVKLIKIHTPLLCLTSLCEIYCISRCMFLAKPMCYIAFERGFDLD